MNLDDLVRSEEAVLNTLLERVRVNRLAEVVDVGYIRGFLRRCSEADLCRAREVFENLTPGRILGRATTVTLIDDDEVEETRRKLPEKFLTFLWAGNGLVKTKVDLVGSVDTALLVERGREFKFGAVLALDGLEPVLSFAMAARTDESRSPWSGRPERCDRRGRECAFCALPSTSAR